MGGGRGPQRGGARGHVASGGHTRPRHLAISDGVAVRVTKAILGAQRPRLAPEPPAPPEGPPAPPPRFARSGGRPLTGVDEPSGSTFTELLGLVGQGDLDDAWDVPRRRLHPDGVGRDQLRRHTGLRAAPALAGRAQLPK